MVGTCGDDIATAPRDRTVRAVLFDFSPEEMRIIECAYDSSILREDYPWRESEDLGHSEIYAIGW